MNLTGYPSIDKPWLKYYSEEALWAELPTGSMFDYVFRRNAEHPSDEFLHFGFLQKCFLSTASAVNDVSDAAHKLGGADDAEILL